MNNQINRIFDERKTFETKRLILKPVEDEDFEIYGQLFTNEQVMKYVSVSCKNSEEELKESFENWNIAAKNKHYFVWTILFNNTKEKIGRFNLCAINRQSSRLDIGYLILPNYWQRCIMSEVFDVMLDYLFNEIKLNKISALTNNSNVASRKLLEKFGFKREGLLKSHTYYPNLHTYEDVARYGLLACEYKKT